jgi:hypothetical protein
MLRAVCLLLTSLGLLLTGSGALAQPGWGGMRAVTSVSWVEEWDPASGRWVRVEDGPPGQGEPQRLIARTPQPNWHAPDAARFGPFRVLDARRAALVGSTDGASPQAFAAMLGAHPGLEVIEFVDASGTSNDLANLALGRAIRAAGLATHVPDGGSARSGAVELFLAGTRRTAAPGAWFAVHSWRDERGREPGDFAPDAPENRLYLDYYMEMGLTAADARAFYAMTNSVPHADALWLGGAEMAQWIAPRPASGLVPMLPQVEAPLRLALARSGSAFTDLARRPWGMPRLAIAPPLRAPKLAYGDVGAGLLDSGTAFP